jgi:hypothetical protein
MMRGAMSEATDWEIDSNGSYVPTRSAPEAAWLLLRQRAPFMPTHHLGQHPDMAPAHNRGGQGVNASVILRRDNFDHPCVLCFLPVTNLQSPRLRLCCYAHDRCTHPTLRRVVSTWTLCGGRLVPRRATERYTSEPPAHARLVCQAYHRYPGRTTRRPHCLDSLTPDAHRTGPLHPRTPRFTTSSRVSPVRHLTFDLLPLVPLPRGPDDALSCDSCCR